MPKGEGNPENLARGAKVAGYEIDSEIGRGNMAVVYRAIQLNLERPIALKVLFPSLAKDQDFLENFRREARAAASFTHPNIVQAFDVGMTDDKINYFAMELVDGGSLIEHINIKGRFRPVRTIEIMTCIAEALDYGFKTQRLTHGDIKPANILLTKYGEPKLADLGLAQTIRNLNNSSDLILTPLYAPPELIQRVWTQGDPRADIYSFGATIFHMLAGMPPFPGTDPKAVLKKHIKVSPPVLSEIIDDFPKELSEYVDTLLSKHPDDRPDTWYDVKEALKSFNKSSKPQVKTSGKIKKANNTTSSAATFRTARISGSTAATISLKSSRVKRSKVRTATSIHKPKKKNNTPVIIMCVVAIVAVLVILIAIKGGSSSGTQHIPAYIRQDYIEMKQRLREVDPQFRQTHIKEFVKKYGRDTYQKLQSNQ